jgi:hypothetical protein
VSTTENRAAANLAVVGGIYEAFGRGDIEFILSQIADDWRESRASRTTVRTQAFHR